MNKYLLSFFLSIALLLTTFGANAVTTFGYPDDAPSKVENPNPKPEKKEIKYNERGQIILETIDKLEESGYITGKNALDAKKEMVLNIESLILSQEAIEIENEENKIKNGDVTSSEFFSLIGFLKIAGIILLLIAAKGIVFKFLATLLKIPPILYQTAFLGASVYLMFYPEVISENQAYYISMFCVIFNVLIVGSIIAVYHNVLLKLFTLNLKPEIIAPAYLTLYFGFFAFYFDSQFLGIFTMVSFVGLFGFTMGTTGLCTWIGYEEEDYLNSSLFVNGTIVVLYSLAHSFDIEIPHVDIFSVGIEYVCAIVLGVTLLIRSSFVCVDDKHFVISLFLMILAEAAGLTAMYLYNLEVIPVIINTIFFIFLLSWVGYLTHEINGIALAFGLGVSIWLVALFIESHPDLFVTALF